MTDVDFESILRVNFETGFSWALKNSLNAPVAFSSALKNSLTGAVDFSLALKNNLGTTETAVTFSRALPFHLLSSGAGVSYGQFYFDRTHSA